MKQVLLFSVVFASALSHPSQAMASEAESQWVCSILCQDEVGKRPAITIFHVSELQTIARQQLLNLSPSTLRTLNGYDCEEDAFREKPESIDCEEVPAGKRVVSEQ